MAPGARPALSIMIQRLWASRLLRHRKAQLLLVNLLTFGLEVCLAAGITYVPPLLLEVGVEEKFMTMVLGESLHLPFLLLWCPGLGWRLHFSCPGSGSEGSAWCVCVGALPVLIYTPQPLGTIHSTHMERDALARLGLSYLTQLLYLVISRTGTSPQSPGHDGTGGVSFQYCDQTHQEPQEVSGYSVASLLQEKNAS